MKLKYLLFNLVIIIFFAIPYIPLDIKAIMGYVFILASAILWGSREAMITAALCTIGAAISSDHNMDIRHKITQSITGTLSFFLIAWFLGRFSDSLKKKNTELSEEIERRKKAEKELNEKLTQLQSVLDTIPSPIFFKALNGKYMGCNHTFEECVGILEEELVGKTSGEIIEEDLVDRCRKSDADLLSGMGKQSNEEVFRYADGSLRNVIISKDIFRDENQKPIGIVGVMTDITDKVEAIKLKQSIIENKQKMDEILENDRLKTEFLSNVSHEFRTPLNVILGSLQLMELYLTANHYAASREKIIKKVAVLKQNSYRLIRHVNNLIDISKIDAREYELHYRNCDIVGLIREITLSVSKFTVNEGIQVSFETDIEYKTLACDEEKIERILLNLLSNAIKFTPKGGNIRVSIFNKPDGLCIEVKDNGIGIPVDKHNQIFKKFCQIDRVFTRQHEGSGIGLSLVKSLVEMHGGTITFESMVGIGTSFLIYLPQNDIDEEALRYNIIRNRAHADRLTVEFSDIYSVGR